MSQYLDDALRACALPIRVWCSENGWVTITDMTDYEQVRGCHMGRMAVQYTALRDKLLQAEEMKG